MIVIFLLFYKYVSDLSCAPTTVHFFYHIYLKILSDFFCKNKKSTKFNNSFSTITLGHCQVPGQQIGALQGALKGNAVLQGDDQGGAVLSGDLHLSLLLRA